MDQAFNLNRLVALFLAEAIRSRRTSLPRAAEISHRVVSRLKLLNSENQVLAFLGEIEKDFQEVSALKQALHFGYHPSEIKVYEAEIKDFASRAFTKDIHLSNAFLQDAAKAGMTIQELCVKYPEFCEFLESSPEKARVLAQLQSQG